MEAREGADGSGLWATETESREQIIDFYRRTWDHADRTMNALSIDAPGHVPWWPHPEVTLFSIIVHVLTETTRHAGHADILREQLDGRTGVTAGQAEPVDLEAREAHCARIEGFARAAQTMVQD